MKALHSLFATGRRLSRRERHVVIGGAVVSAVALLATGVIMPLAKRWSDRDNAYAARREQWARLSALTESTAALRHSLDQQQAAFASDESRLVNGATPALGASALQALLQRYADGSGVQVERIDVAGEPRPDRSGLLAIPVQLQARGDTRALVAFIYQLEYGNKLLVIDEFTLNSNLDTEIEGVTPARRVSGQQLLSWTLRLHGLYEPAEGVVTSAASALPPTPAPDSPRVGSAP